MSTTSKPDPPPAQKTILKKLQPEMDKLYEALGIDEEKTETYIDSMLSIMGQANKDKNIELYQRMHKRVTGRPVKIIPKDHNLEKYEAEAWFH